MAGSVSYSKSLNSGIARAPSPSQKNHRENEAARSKQVESRASERQRRQSELRAKEAEQSRIDKETRQRNQTKRDRLTESRLDNERGKNIDFKA
ncbi:MAG: hypothetical protein VX619_10810 [bacterium]|nr:hypothetical protein [bacterium]